jgi:hypothetical protein
VEWLYVVIALIAAQIAGMSQVIYRRAYPKFPAYLLISVVGICFLIGWVSITLAVTGDALFSFVFGAVLSALTLCGLALILRAKFGG